MTKINFSTTHQAISLTRYQLRNIEEKCNNILNEKINSESSLLQKFSLSPTERKRFLSNKNLLQKLCFYLFVESEHINNKISKQISNETVLEKICQKRIAPLKPPSRINDTITEIFQGHKKTLSSMRLINNSLTYLRLTTLLATTVWLNYAVYKTATDWASNCSEKSLNIKCPTSGFFKYLYSQDVSFFAIPVITLIGVAAKICDDKITSSLRRTTLSKAKNNASQTLLKISKVKDFLLDYSVDPEFTRPIFARALNE
ncbi:MAG: hypothetical protein S4CHLAM6_08760 [Chlamydiae bacterium]|nr:hypothetical protein [Chlamydiota bacterium]